VAWVSSLGIEEDCSGSARFIPTPFTGPLQGIDAYAKPDVFALKDLSLGLLPSRNRLGWLTQ
jgi:hypothetical protein